MPFSIVKIGDKYKIYNKDKKKAVNKTFSSKEKAKNMIKVYERYTKEKK